MSVLRQALAPWQESLLAVVRRLADEYEWSIGVTFAGSAHLLEGSIDRPNWRIALTVHPQGSDLLEQRLGVPVGEGEAALQRLVRAACQHEIGHWEYCRCDGRWMAQIVAGICGGVSQSGRQFQGRETVIRRLTNMFCDIVVNTCLAQWGRQREDFIAGMAAFYLDQWLSATPLPPRLRPVHGDPEPPLR